MPVRIGPAPPPMDPRGMHSGTTQAKRRRRPTKPPRSGCSGGPIRSGCWFVEPTVRVQIAARACGSVAEEPMRSPAERVDAGASPARSIVPQWLTQWERPPRKREDAGASPACGLGRVGQPETDPIPSKGRSAVRVPSGPPCPRSLPDRTVAREATGGGSIPLGGVGHVV